MKIALGSDHGGFELKEIIKDWLLAHDYKVEDFGSHDTLSCDYPDSAASVARAIVSGDAQLGILICGTGIGM
ncbi:MAG TPA: ribose-5-phosphate isomerase, partial [Peptococcaceae bacterium]|nr:ribose-5-phosphate isomerase [Peptococcaceae bacterium]